MKVKLASVFICLSLVGCGSTGVLDWVITSLFSSCDEVKYFLGVTYSQMNFTSRPTPASIDVVLYGDSIWNKTWINLVNSGDDLWLNPAFDTSLPTEIIFYGFTQNSFSVEINMLITSFIAKGQRNVILIDAYKVIGYWYMYSSTALRFIADHVTQELIIKLVNKGYNKSLIHLIGFDLGAHTSGYIGKTFKNATGSKLPWITGLDPSGPCFFDSITTDRLASTDADFVDVIHSNAGTWGIDSTIGVIDFYPNGGRIQAGAVFPINSHHSALYYYAESVLKPTNFPSVWCKSWDLFLWGACSWNGKTSMGYGVGKSNYGKFYCNTNGYTPYSKGDAGIPWFNFFAWLVSLFV